MNRKKIYFDCDNTMGLPCCDMDDGMALLYLLGRNDIELASLTTSFGNNTIDKVHENTERMFRELGLGGIPLHKGAASPDQRQSDASRFLACDIAERREKVTLLVTGSPTNIYAAFLENPAILEWIEEIVFMGGILEPLLIGHIPMSELNFSSDAEAMHFLLNCPVKKTVLSAQTCLGAFFDATMMATVEKFRTQVPAFDYMMEPLKLWYDCISLIYSPPGFHAWDVVAAAYVTSPELYDRNEVSVVSTEEDLKSGFLRLDSGNSQRNDVNIPLRILDKERFWTNVFDAWKSVKIPQAPAQQVLDRAVSY